MKFGVLVSGNGTNLQALLDAAGAGDLAPAEIAVVISNKPEVAALHRADNAGVPSKVVEHRGLARDAFEDELLAVLDAHRVEAVVLAGFMRVLSPHFLARFPQRIINTHPSLLPAFPGKDAVGQALAHGVKLSGVTIHFVDTSLDGGPIIEQAAVPIEAFDEVSTLQARIQREEHRLLPAIVRSLARGELSCQGRVVTRTGARAE
jgi:phosphoribosylglycinamide formyltransferase-1